ncbi:MAG: aminopeptidase [Sarcina sp.]
MMTKLTREKVNIWEEYSDSQRKEVFELGERYRKFLSVAKTERESIDELVKEAEKNGYRDLEVIVKNAEALKAGDKVYINNKGKSLAIFNIGTKALEEGLRIIGSHVDAPRIDLKQNPVYEDNGLVLFDTHYYGGVKKYQWVTLPLALHGVVIKRDGTKVNIAIGEDDKDPVLGISDLLIHLSADQLTKAGGKVIEGEDLNVLAGSFPSLTDKEAKEKVKLNILEILNEKYGIIEDDFVSAELEIVPAGQARDFGLDRSMVMGYGHDDRICAYTSFEAALDVENPDKTIAGLFVDKEEIGSVGATGMHSKFFENAITEIMDRLGDYSELKLRRALQNSKMLSADVTVAYDPNYPAVVEKNNCAFFGQGVVFSKYTGARGKSGCNDANAEYMAYLRNMMDEAGVYWQTAELGKVDQGGGGTIAYILAQYNMEVIDCGVALHNMHAPWEVASKIDIYETKKCYKVFFERA